MKRILQYIDILILILLILFVSIEIIKIIIHPKPTIKYVKQEVKQEPVVMEVIF